MINETRRELQSVHRSYIPIEQYEYLLYYMTIWVNSTETSVYFITYNQTLWYYSSKISPRYI